MEDDADLAPMPLEEVEQRFRRQQRREPALAEVAPLVVAAEPVADDEIRLAALLERRNQIRADEAGAAGDDDHLKGGL
jgi:hypothetical protein